MDKRFAVLSLLALCGVLSVTADCPAGTSVGPCLCIIDSNSNLSLQCKNVTTGTEITDALNTIQVAQISSLDIIGSPSLTTMPDSAFGTTSVLSIRFYNTGLKSLTASVFSGQTASTLEALYVKHCEDFVDIDADMVSSLTALKELFVAYTGVTSLGATLGSSSTLEYLDLSHNDISSIPISYFSAVSSLSVLFMPFNSLTSASLNNVTLYFPTSDTLYIDFGYNMLTDGLPEINFSGAVPKELVLSGNDITSLEEQTYAPLLQAMDAAHDDEPYLLLDHNPLTCGCEFEWIVASPQKSLIRGGICENGQTVDNLQAFDFADC